MILRITQTHVDPLKNWFYPLHLNVPDHCHGEDPRISYDRVIRRQFTGSFHAQLTAVAVDDKLGFPVCSFQSGEFEYYPRDEMRVSPYLSEFVGRTCNLEPGRYRLEVTWHPLRSGYLDETVSLVSNIFSVKPSSTQECTGDRG